MPPAFDEYVRARSAALVRFAHQLCRDRHLAEDMVQEVLARAYRRWERIESEHPDMYLRRALVWQNLSWWRRMSHHERPSAQAFGAVAVADDFTGQHAMRDELWTMLGTLPRNQRVVLTLRYYEDLTDEHIAALMGCSRNTVRVHAHRGLATLRTRLTQVPAPGREEPGFPSVSVEAVRRRAAALQHRRRATLAGLSAVLLAAVAVALPLWPQRTPPPVVTPSPSPSVSASTSYGFAPPVFPYEPGYLPDQTTPVYVTLRAGQVGLLQYGIGYELSIDISSIDVDLKREGSQLKAVDVNGVPATLRTTGSGDGIAVDLAWRAGGRWLLISSSGLTAPQVERIARELRPGAVTAVPPFRWARMPEGYQLSRLADRAVCMAPAARKDEIAGDGEVCVEIITDFNPPQDTNVVVAGKQGQFFEGDGPMQLLVVLDPNRAVIVTQVGRSLPREQIVALAELAVADLLNAVPTTTPSPTS